MRVKAKTGVFYNGKRYEKETELDIKKEAMDENLFEELEEKKTTAKENKKQKEGETTEEE